MSRGRERDGERKTEGREGGWERETERDREREVDTQTNAEGWRERHTHRGTQTDRDRAIDRCRDRPKIRMPICTIIQGGLIRVTLSLLLHVSTLKRFFTAITISKYSQTFVLHLLSCTFVHHCQTLM